MLLLGSLQNAGYGWKTLPHEPGGSACCYWDRHGSSAATRLEDSTPRAGWVSVLLLESLRNAVQPPGSRTHHVRLRNLLGQVRLVPAGGRVEVGVDKVAQPQRPPPEPRHEERR